MMIPGRALPAVIADCIFTSLAFLVVCSRLGTRVFVIKNVGIDDYLIAAAMLASIGFLTIVMLQIKAGLGRQISFLELPGFLHALWATIPVYNLALILCKLSITVQCYRVLRTPKMQKFLRGYLVVLVIYGLWTVLGSIFNCWPIEAYWAATQGVTGVCMNKNAVTFSNAALNIATDIVLVAVPVPLLWKLQIPKKQKIVLVCVFGAGTFACITSIIRLQALYMIGIAPESEQSVQGVDIAIWSCIEINVGIICASVPALKPLVVKLFPKMLLSNLHARSKGAYYGGAGGGGGGISGRTHAAGHNTASGRGVESAVQTEIQVEQEFEMKSVAIGAGRRSDDDGKTSRDGSEKNLVTSSWQDDAYVTGKAGKKVTITSRPREIV